MELYTCKSQKEKPHHQEDLQRPFSSRSHSFSFLYHLPYYTSESSQQAHERLSG